MKRSIESSRDQVRIEGDIAYVTLTRGKVAIIDAADAEAVGAHLWHFGKSYAVRKDTQSLTEKKVRMHRFLLGMPDGSDDQCDHINRDKLDNRRSNLRVCSHVQNQFNSRIRDFRAGRPVTCKYKGVYVAKGKYIAKIGREGKKVYLGSYADPVEAAKAYDAAARRLHGEFALTNFPEDHSWSLSELWEPDLHPCN